MKKQIIPIAIVVVVLLAGIALWFGLRGGTTPSRGDNDKGITVFAPKDTEIIVIENLTSDDEETTGSAEKYIVEKSDKYTLSLEPGSYTLLVSRGSDYYPWKKTITVTEDTSTEFYPLLLPQEPGLETIDSSSPVFETVTQAFSTPATLPTVDSPKLNAEGTAEIYVEGNTISIKWLGETEDIPEFLCPGVNVDECRQQPIFTFQEGTVENIDFFGENEEMLILDRGAEIKALEIDRRDNENRNQQPIFSGTAAAFRIIDGDIYISDSGTIWKVVLE